MTKAATSQYLEQVRSYYDTMNPLYVKHIRKTYQAGLFTTDSNANATCAHNLLQADTAKKFVQQTGLKEQIRVHIGDFHHLPFADGTFDVVCFFESSGYSYDRQQLFAEVYRVLRPEGSLYIEDVFCKEPPFSDQQQQELEEFNRVYVYKTPRISETVEVISAVGFQIVKSRNFSEIISTKDFVKAMFEYKHSFPFMSEFGKFHYRQFQCLAIFFGEVKAHKLAV